ncbi:MAG: NADH-quinone oxidoreductase subunit L [Verrucomicrobiae bacterium]|nr:NADH-quinone oxidoreductase subunit L [Verrucomicrobiae bacterium]
MQPTHIAEYLAPIILFLPLAAAVVIALFVRDDDEQSAQFSIGSVGLAFVASVTLFLLGGGRHEIGATWLDVGGLQVSFGLLIDDLSLLMLMIVTGVGLLVQIFSKGYMKGDPGYSRYFAFLSLFTFSMLGIVLADNLVMMFVFWELVGLSSYLLISFWFHKPSAADAGKKAFLTNRVGDFGFLFGILLVWAATGTLNIGELATKLAVDPHLLGAGATCAGLLLFCGAIGKSAQFPLHVWLPDAMEGPTPVSALIHAATMVAAGVYMLCRLFFLLTPDALEVIAVIGAVTSFLAALMAFQQNDIKRILAYSTLSQLGYMVMAVGIGSPNAAMYHLTTHAFFKAMLFLGAGSVIHALHHEQDIWKMGGLKSRLPGTYRTFWIGTMALCGVWPFAGFFSKDAILSSALGNGAYCAFLIGTLVAAMTAFYMTRLVLVAFGGVPRGDGVFGCHESPSVMTRPLWLLAIPSVIAGFWGIDVYLAETLPGGHGHASTWYEAMFAPINHSPLAAMFGLLAVAFGHAFARRLYANAVSDPLPLSAGLLAKIMRDRFYFDEIYAFLIRISQGALSTVADWFDRWIIAGLFVRGVSGFTDLFGRALRMLQTGNLQTYAFWLAAGIVVILFLTLPGAKGAGH